MKHIHWLSKHADKSGDTKDLKNYLYNNFDQIIDLDASYLAQISTSAKEGLGLEELRQGLITSAAIIQNEKSYIFI